MRAFRLKLVEQLLEEPRTLSRNRHFDAFADADGRSALRTSRRIRALEREILAQTRRGQPVKLEESDRDGETIIRIELTQLRATRVAYLSKGELELLLKRPGVREAMGR